MGPKRAGTFFNLFFSYKAFGGVGPFLEKVPQLSYLHFTLNSISA